MQGLDIEPQIGDRVSVTIYTVDREGRQIELRSDGVITRIGEYNYAKHFFGGPGPLGLLTICLCFINFITKHNV